MTQPSPAMTQPEPALVETPLGTFQYKYLVMVLYIMATFMQIMDGTALNVAIPTVAGEFGVEATDVDWAVIGYLLGLTSLLPAGGWLANRFGSRNVFLGALAVFVGASLLCGLAATLNQLIAFRALQGAGSGILIPVGSAMLMSAFPLAERARAATTIVAVVVIAPAVGPVLGGFLVEFLSWRWIFFINLPIGAFALAVGFTWLRSMPRNEIGGLDITGLILAAAGLSGVLFAISEGPTRGFSSPLTLVALIGGVGALVALVWWQLRTDSPLLNLSLFRDRLFRTCNLLALPAFAGFMGVIFILPIFLQSFLDYSPLKTGLTMLPQPLGVLFISQIVGRRLYGQIGPRRLITAGLAGAFASTALMTFIDLDTSIVTILALMFGRGASMALLFVPLQTAVYASTSIPDMPQATTLFSMIRQGAPAFGVALAATWIAARSLAPLNRGSDVVLSTAEKLERIGPYQEAIFVSALPYLVGIVFALMIKDEDAAETMVARSRS